MDITESERKVLILYELAFVMLDIGTGLGRGSQTNLCTADSAPSMVAAVVEPTDRATRRRSYFVYSTGGWHCHIFGWKKIWRNNPPR